MRSHCLSLIARQLASSISIIVRRQAFDVLQSVTESSSSCTTKVSRDSRHSFFRIIFGIWYCHIVFQVVHLFVTTMAGCIQKERGRSCENSRTTDRIACVRAVSSAASSRAVPRSFYALAMSPFQSSQPFLAISFISQPTTERDVPPHG